MRKMKLKETMLLFTLLKKMSIENVVTDLLSEETEELLKKIDNQKQKQIIIAGKVITHIINNIDKVENELYKILASYKYDRTDPETISKIEEIDNDETFVLLESMLKNGVPDMLKKLIPIDDIKKNMEK